MLSYPQIDPVLLSLGPVKIQWYGVMYLLAFLLAFFAARYRINSPGNTLSPVRTDQLEDLIFYAALGVIIGGRCGYVFFYGFDQLLKDPLWLFKIWEGGMSFHGGLMGVMAAMWIYAKTIKGDFVQIMDFISPLVPIGLGLGRLGNFINQELWGRPTEVAWGMVFPRDPAQLVRHPSQLYQFALEGVALFLILFWFSSKQRPRFATSGLFLLCYGIFRFMVEFVRQPDSHLGFVWLEWMTRGQQLCLPMMLGGVALLAFAYRDKLLHKLKIK